VVAAAGSPPLTESDVISYARTRLASYKCPTSVAFLPGLPRNPSGKLLKRQLREDHGEDRAVDATARR